MKIDSIKRAIGKLDTNDTKTSVSNFNCHLIRLQCVIVSQFDNAQYIISICSTYLNFKSEQTSTGTVSYLQVQHYFIICFLLLC